MKLKSYLRGLGLGIIITTLILAVANNARMAGNVNEASVKTVAPIINYTKDSTEAQTENKSETLEATISRQEPTTVAPTVVEPTTEEPTEPSNEGSAVTVILQNIASSERAAQAIQQAGIIDNWNDFNNYLVRNGYATRIHDGTYTLTKGQDYESIAQTITSR